MPNLSATLIFAAFGLVFGSFANVLILRDDRRASILTGRSACPHCGHPLAWYELIPVLSFVLQTGRCRSCRKPISGQYPLVELLSLALFLFALHLGLVAGSLFMAGLLAASLLMFLVVAVIDLRTMSLPVDYVVAAGLLGALAMLVGHVLTVKEVAEGLLLGGGLPAAVLLTWKALFRIEGMGSGDVWVGAAVGVVAGSPLALVALAAAVLAGAASGILALPFSKKGLQTPIPFGPFLVAGLLVALGCGQAIIHWYTLYI